MKMRKITGSLTVAVVVAAAMFAGNAQATDHASAASGGVDTTPPDPFVRARARQDIDDVFEHGIQTTCGTEDDERPVTCSMTAKRKGMVLVSDSGLIHSPYNRYQFHLKLTGAQKDHILRADPPIEIKLVLRVSDEAGNVGTDQRRIKLVKDLYH